jgi:hypothetical protein
VQQLVIRRRMRLSDESHTSLCLAPGPSRCVWERHPLAQLVRSGRDALGRPGEWAVHRRRRLQPRALALRRRRRRRRLLTAL